MAKQGSTDLNGQSAGKAFPIVMGVVGVTVAALVAGMPQDSLDLLMWRLWLPQVFSAATPPIGATGRTLLAVVALLPFAAAGAAAWMWRGRFSLPVRAPKVGRTKAGVAGEAPTIRRADAHPDAAPRRPIRAAEDLGPPLPIQTISVTRGVPEPEQPLPYNLDQPLAAFDPIAIPDVPRAPVRAVAPLVPTPPAPPEKEAQSEIGFAWGDEAQAEEPVLAFLAMAPEPEPEPILAPEPVVVARVADEATDVASEAPSPAADHPMPTSILRRSDSAQEAPKPVAVPPVAENASIASLLDRLEQGARRKAAPVEEPRKAESLDDTLVMLRRLAAG